MTGTDEYGRIIGADGLCHCPACDTWRAGMPDIETAEHHLARLVANDLLYREIGSRRAGRFLWEAGVGGSSTVCPCGCGAKMIDDGGIFPMS